jgi:hypothetical protein
MEPPSTPSAPGSPPRSPARSPARSKVQPAAVALATIAGLSLLFSLLGLCAAILSWMSPGVFHVDLDDLGVHDRDVREALRSAEVLFYGPLGVATHLVEVLISVFVFVAAIQMSRLRAWPVAVAASGLAAIPCLMPYCCCCFNFPIAVWCLAVLLQPDVRSAFEGPAARE